jgi:hypothetical protein
MFRPPLHVYHTFVRLEFRLSTTGKLAGTKEHAMTPKSFTNFRAWRFLARDHFFNLSTSFSQVRAAPRLEFCLASRAIESPYFTYVLLHLARGGANTHATFPDRLRRQVCSYRRLG